MRSAKPHISLPTVYMKRADAENFAELHVRKSEPAQGLSALGSNRLILLRKLFANEKHTSDIQGLIATHHK